MHRSRLNGLRIDFHRLRGSFDEVLAHDFGTHTRTHGNPFEIEVHNHRFTIENMHGRTATEGSGLA